MGGLLLAGGAAVAQPDQGVRLQFRFSKVVLASGDTLVGPVAVHFATDLLEVGQPDGSVRTFAPASVAAFAVQGQGPLRLGRLRPGPAFDPTVIRLFITLPWAAGRLGGRPEPTFFEQLSAGPVVLLRRQSYVARQQAANLAGATPPVPPSRQVPMGAALAPAPVASLQFRTVMELKDSFYLAWPSGEIRLLRHARKDLLAAFAAQAEQLQAYAKAHGLGYGTAADLHELVGYANTLAPPR